MTHRCDINGCMKEPMRLILNGGNVKARYCEEHYSEIVGNFKGFKVRKFYKLSDGQSVCGFAKMQRIERGFNHG
jgi:hypothetical protein